MNTEAQLPAIGYVWSEKKDFPYADYVFPSTTAKGRIEISEKVCTFTEFDPLTSVVVGYVDQTACLTKDAMNRQVGVVDDVAIGPYPQRYIEKSREEQNEFVDALESVGVKVYRPGKVDWGQKYMIHGFETTGFNIFSTRDIHFPYHDSLYEFPTFAISRMAEFRSFEWIEKQLTQLKSKCFSSWQIPTHGYFYEKPENRNAYKSDVPFIEAANLLKLGLDILFLISSSGSEGAYRNFRKLMEDRYDRKVRVHPIRDVYLGMHVDTTFSVIGYNKQIGKYLVVADGSKVTNPTNIPAIFRGSNWVILQFWQYVENEIDEKYNLASKRLGMNFLTVTPELISLDHRQIYLIKALEHYGIKTMKLSNTYGREMGGGHHCQTCDISREDTHGFGKILETPRNELSQNQLAGLFDPKLLKQLQDAGDMDEWVNICNEREIFPTYLTDHLTAEDVEKMKGRHEKYLKEYKQGKKHEVPQ